MSQVILIHPGTTDFDDQQRVQGDLDLPLNERGITQSTSIARELSQSNVEAVYSAPQESSRQTAELVAAALQVPFKTSEELRNINQGLWQGLCIEEIRRKYPKVIKQWEEMPTNICPPGGETVSEALVRLRKALQKPLSKHRVFAVVAADPAWSLVKQIVQEQSDVTLCPICNEDRCGNWELICSPGDEVDVPMPVARIPVKSADTSPKLTAAVQSGATTP